MISILLTRALVPSVYTVLEVVPRHLVFLEDTLVKYSTVSKQTDFYFRVRVRGEQGYKPLVVVLVV